jgi:hypothetical protein
MKKQDLIDLTKKICKDKGLNTDETNLICAVINCESSFRTDLIHYNKNGTADYGICQFNDYWYWKKEKVISPDDALNNPEKSIKIMVDMYKRGRLKNWVCYSGNYYKKHYL